MDATLRLILDTKALLQRLSDVVREWTASTSRMSRAAEGVDFDLAQREAGQLRRAVEQMAAGVVGNLAKIEVAADKIKTDASEREVKQLEKSIAQLSNAAERELSKIQRAAERVQLQKLRKEAVETEKAIDRMTKEADRDLRRLEKSAEKIDLKRARDEAKAVQQAIKTLEQSGTRSFRVLEQASQAAGVSLQSGIGGALTRLPPRVQVLQRRFETALAAMRTAADRVSFQKAQFEAQRLESAINRMAQSAQKNMDRVRQSADRASAGFSRFGGIVGRLNSTLGALGIFLSARILAQWAGDAINAAIQLEAFNAQLRASVNTVDEANDLYSFANEQTERLGLNFASVVEGTARFAAATKRSNLTLEQRKDVLLAVFESARVLNLSEQRLGNTLLALEQIASKATVSMEELRRQLGDNIPGAVSILADQMGVTQQELLKLIETNQVLSEEALPLLAKGLRETFGEGVQASIGTFAAQLGRMEKALFDARVAFGGGFAEVIGPDLERLRDVLKELTPVFRVLGITGGVALKTLALALEGIVLGIAKAGQGLGEFTAFLTGVTEGAGKADRALKALDAGTLFTAGSLSDLIEGVIDRIGGVEDELGRTTQAAQILDQVLLAAFEESRFGGFEEGLAAVHTAFLLAADGGKLSERQTNLLSHALEAVEERAENLGKEAPVSLGLMVKALKDGSVEARNFAKELILALDAARNEEFAKSTQLLSEAWNEAIESGKVAKDLLDEFGPVLKILIDSMREAGQEVPAVLLAIAGQLELTLKGVEDAADQVGRALEEAAERAKKARDELFGTEEAAQALVDTLLDLTHQLDLENLTQAQAEAIRDLVDDIEEAFEKLGKELPPEIAHIAEAVEALGFGALGTRDALQELAEELRRTVQAAGDLDDLGAEKLEALKEKIQEVLDAFAQYGEEVPADIQAVADKLGVTTTLIEKELEKQAKAAEKAADEEEKASKRRVDALEQVANAFRKLREIVEGAGDGAKDIAELEEKIDELEDARFNFTGSLDDLDELDNEIGALRDQLETLRESQGATGESAREMSDAIDDAIRGLIDKLEPSFARLSQAQQGAVESLLTRLQALGQDGVATGDDVADSLQGMINVLEAADQPTEDLRSALQDMRQGGLDVGQAFKALREEIAESFQELEKGPEGVAKGVEKLEKDVERHKQLLGELSNAYETTFGDIQKRVEVALSLWDRLNEKCEKHKECLQGTAAALGG